MQTVLLKSRRVLAFALGILATVSAAVPALSFEDGQSDDFLATTTVSDAELAQERGGTQLPDSLAQNNGTQSNDGWEFSAGGEVTTGANTFSNQAIDNTRMSIIAVNSGNNVAMQNQLSVTVNLH